jgi:uncharacterized membrane protein
VTPRRIEFFSDAVFAIAATLLVLDLRLPGPGPAGHSLTYQLLHAWPDYFAYVVSFLTIGIMWINHHKTFAHVRRVDRPLLVLNLWLLMWVVLIPFPTRLVAEHLTGPGGTAATVTYGLIYIAAGTAFGQLWTYIVTHAEQLETVTRPHELRRSMPRNLVGGVGCVGGTLVAAFVSPVAGLTIFGLTNIYYLFDQQPDPPDTSEPGEPDDEGQSPGWPEQQTPVQQTPVQRTAAGNR